VAARFRSIHRNEALMLIVVDPHSGVPVYRQLMDQIKFHISSGLIGPGDELPSTRTLSAELGINPMTISKAYSYLERDGVIERHPGRPLRVKAIDEDDARTQRIDQLKETLKSGVTVAKQLGIDNDDALRVFDEMLRDGTDREKDS
jgi:GntR family transcriptional regulator